MKQQSFPLYLPKFCHGRTNMESGIISLKEAGWTVPRIAKLFRIPEAIVAKILRRFGWDK